jgi:hypothetical protein
MAYRWHKIISGGMTLENCMARKSKVAPAANNGIARRLGGIARQGGGGGDEMAAKNIASKMAAA